MKSFSVLLLVKRLKLSPEKKKIRLSVHYGIAFKNICYKSEQPDPNFEILVLDIFKILVAL